MWRAPYPTGRGLSRRGAAVTATPAVDAPDFIPIIIIDRARGTGMMAAVERHTTPSRPRRAAGARPTLEAAGRRSTPQREAVYRYLAGVDHHPTAEEVYLAVKRRVPRRSLATVYTALEAL